MSIRGSRYYNQLCANFNGTDEYMSRTGSLSFAGDTAGALSFWIRPASTFGANGTKVVFWVGTSGQARVGFGTRRATPTGSSTYISITGVNAAGTTTANYAATTTALAANTWYHVLWQSNGTSWSCWINGVSQTLVEWAVLGNPNNGNWFGDYTGASPWLTIGVQNLLGAIGTGAWFDGRLDEFVYVSGRALTSGEVAELYNSGVPKDPRGLSFATELEVIYRMGDRGDTASTVLDRTNGGNNLTLVNMDTSNYVPV